MSEPYVPPTQLSSAKPPERPARAGRVRIPGYAGGDFSPDPDLDGKLAGRDRGLTPPESWGRGAGGQERY